MYTLNPMTNNPTWENILNAMTTEAKNLQTRWTAMGGYRSHYYAQPGTAAVVRSTRRATVKRRVVWSRVMAPILLLGCIFAYRGNANLEGSVSTTSIHAFPTAYAAIVPNGRTRASFLLDVFLN